MGFKYLSNTPLDTAKKEYIDLLIKNGLSSKSETIEVRNSLGRITSMPVYANICSPHYNASAMDGIAVKAKSTFGATETTPITLDESQFKMVDTGDIMPEDYDAVIMIEDVVELDENTVKIHQAASPWQHIRQIGEDICAGEMILSSYSEISPSAIGAMLASALLDVTVIKKPLVGIIPTGDEIVSPSANPQSGSIIEFNSSVFSAMFKRWNVETKTFSICKDEFNTIKSRVEEALEICDIVIINAGSSAGREDYTCDVIKSIGEVLYHGIAIKPGKPTILGFKGSKPIIGVPGYPVSGIIVIEQLLLPIIEAYYGIGQIEKYEYKNATLSQGLMSGLKYQEFIRLRMGYVNDKYIVTPLNRGAGVISSFMKAEAILEVAQGVEGYNIGDEVSVRLLQPLSRIKNSLLVMGSHDPALDEIGDLLHKSDNKLYMSSSHVGSMGAIMAVKRKEAHMGAIHLLDEHDGSYNISYVRKYFPDTGVYLLQCLGREQGLMVAKNNPKKIFSIGDLYKENISYINRQKGSGTRILFEYLNKKENLDPSEIYGYEREEFTHTSVAANIAYNSADVGLGIYSAAKMFDLDFIPICTERYDLLIAGYAWDTPMVKALLEILKSDAFKERIEAMGGYTLEEPGRVYKI